MQRRDFFGELVSGAAQRLGLSKYIDFSFRWNVQDLLRRLESDAAFFSETRNASVMRTGLPVTVNGEVFPGFVTALKVEEFPDPFGDARKTTLAVSCAHRDGGLSVWEWMDGRHVVDSYRNVRFDAETAIALRKMPWSEAGAVLSGGTAFLDGRLILVHVAGSGLFAVVCIVEENGDSFVSVLKG